MATLSQLVTETTTIKNNLVSCHTNLKNNLTKKGVQCSSTDKLLSLVNKVGEINTGKKWASGTAKSSSAMYECITLTVNVKLQFVPSLIVVMSDRDRYNAVYSGTYFSSSYSDLMYSGGRNNNLSSFNYAYVKDTGFKIPINEGNMASHQSTECRWIFRYSLYKRTKQNRC